MIEYSEKQRELLRLWQRGELRRINILEGSVRSGKTWVTLVLWALWVATMPEDASYLMVAKTLTSLRRNCLELLKSWWGGRTSRTVSRRKRPDCSVGWCIWRALTMPGQRARSGA